MTWLESISGCQTCAEFDVGGISILPSQKRFPLAGKASEMPDVAFSEPVPLEEALL